MAQETLSFRAPVPGYLDISGKLTLWAEISHAHIQPIR